MRRLTARRALLLLVLTAAARESGAQAADSARQAADNYNHLMEQPTIFYAAALAIQVAGHADPMAVHFAWVYVGVRVLHSLLQISINLVPVRFLLFVISTGVLAAMVFLRSQ